jgi:hypothetical protein
MTEDTIDSISNATLSREAQLKAKVRHLSRQIAKEVLPPEKATLVDHLDGVGLAQLLLGHVRPNSAFPSNTSGEEIPMPEFEAGLARKRALEEPWARDFRWTRP